MPQALVQPRPALPEPEFPHYPEMLGEREPGPTGVTRRLAGTVLRGRMAPILASLASPGGFHPRIAYLFIEWSCNRDCPYCQGFDNGVPGMNGETARQAIDWLHGAGCRSLALMGGEVLLRPQFVHKVVDYATRKGFRVHVPTNGRLMRPEVIDRLADAGAATFSLVLDSVRVRPELPNPLAEVWGWFDYLIRKQPVYGYRVLLQIPINRLNLDDVRMLTEIAQAAGIETGYHLHPSPVRDGEFRSTAITPKDWPRVDQTIDWLVEKRRAGYRMVNPVRRLEEMKALLRGKLQQWDCPAGRKSVVIRTNGTLAPCLPFYGATGDWGAVGQPCFPQRRLEEMKQECHQHCFYPVDPSLACCSNPSSAETFGVSIGE